MRRFPLPGVSFFIIIVCLVFIIFYPQIIRVYYPFLYREEIEELGVIYDLEPELIAALIHVESKFNPAAESSRGARGLMQIMPPTGVWAAQGLGWLDFQAEQLFDPLLNLEIGCWYLAGLREEFSSLTIALAAYNAGRGNVRRWLEEGIWDGTCENTEDIPFRETRLYLNKIERTWERYRVLY